MRKPILKSEKECVYCLSCAEVCQHNAISTKTYGFDNRAVYVNFDQCVGCLRCESICQNKIHAENFPKKAFVVINNDQELLAKSASGGAFSAFAKLVLGQGGAVFGACLSFGQDGIVVKHECVENLADLPKILGSKYVQSDCSEAYKNIKRILKEQRPVLFGGTSCQVKALIAYLDGFDISNLYTVDLICHGVPSIDFLNNYVKHLENKFKGNIEGLSFRTKEAGKIKYQLSCSVLKKNKQKTVIVPLKKSVYYRMFMGAESYQEACYQCEFASLDKPADITVGDYFEIQEDYPELLTGSNALKIDMGVSCVIVHSKKGLSLFNHSKDLLKHVSVDARRVVASHAQLQAPSRYNHRLKLLHIYHEKGFSGLKKFYRRKDILNWKAHVSKLVGRNNIKRIKRLLKHLSNK